MKLPFQHVSNFKSAEDLVIFADKNDLVVDVGNLKNDGWGQEFKLAILENSIRLISAGPNGRF